MARAPVAPGGLNGGPGTRRQLAPGPGPGPRPGLGLAPAVAACLGLALGPGLAGCTARLYGDATWPWPVLPVAGKDQRASASVQVTHDYGLGPLRVTYTASTYRSSMPPARPAEALPYQLAGATADGRWRWRLDSWWRFAPAATDATAPCPRAAPIAPAAPPSWACLMERLQAVVVERLGPAAAGADLSLKIVPQDDARRAWLSVSWRPDVLPLKLAIPAPGEDPEVPLGVATWQALADDVAHELLHLVSFRAARPLYPDKAAEEAAAHAFGICAGLRVIGPEFRQKITVIPATAAAPGDTRTVARSLAAGRGVRERFAARFPGVGVLRGDDPDQRAAVLEGCEKPPDERDPRLAARPSGGN